MRTNGFKVSLRILFKYRLYTGISLAGVAIAITSFWFIANFVKNSHQYDAFHSNATRIYRLSMEVTAGGSTEHYATTGKPLARLLSQDYPGISNYARLTSQGDVIIKVNHELFSEDGVYRVNPGTLDVFSFDFIRGNQRNFLAGPNSIMLSRHLAEKYFNSVDVVDKSIILGDTQYIVKGVFEDWPKNSHLDVKALLLAPQDADVYGPQDWFDLEHYSYVLLDPNSDQVDLNEKLNLLISDQLTPILEDSGIEVKFQSQPLAGLYFAPGLIDDVPKGNRMYVNALTFAGLLVLLISGLNYINLSLTQSTRRLKEISIKKILGISRRQLLWQNGMESLIMTFLVMLLSGLLILTLDNLYFQYSGLHAIEIADNWRLLLIIFSLTFVFGMLGTSYAGVNLSVSGIFNSKSGINVNVFKKGLLGIQFSIASIIIIATLTMNKQVDFMKNKDLGFSQEEVLIIGLPDNEELKSDFIQFRERVKDFATVENASLIGGGALPGEDNGKEIFEVKIDDELAVRVYNFYRIDENYCKLLNIKFSSGRNFEAERLSDQSETIIINEALAKSLHWQNPIGQTIWYGEQPHKVIGVVQNFHNKSLHGIIEPIVFIYDSNYSANLLVKAQGSDVKLIVSLWADFFPETPFALTYFDQFLAAKYTKEDTLFNLAGFFAIVSLVLCCMGLLAVFSLQMLQKTKEMSIRKVLGANSVNLIKTATKSYVFIAMLAFGIAIPVAWLLMKRWLNEFSYRIEMNASLFIFSALLILSVICITLFYHVLKTVNVNPAEALKNE